MNGLRRLKRSVARTNMKRAGHRQINKGSNAFRYVWREWVKPVKVVQRRTRRGRGAGKLVQV